MFRKPCLFLLIIICGTLLVTANTGWAEDTSPLPNAHELTAKLGWTPEEAISRLGAPLSIFPYRGSNPEEDNVVFYYPDNFYLFWFHDRVWQVRVDERWNGDVDGVGMGMSLPEVTDIWGPPVNDWDGQPTWTLPDRGYPVRIRLYFSEDGKLDDIYAYRSDW